MGKYYNKFLGKNIDLAPLGIARQENNDPYFCTPRGASIIGWAGVDGIHYCFVRGFGEMVFAVMPMDIAPDYVKPLAASFEDFLRLLLACKDASFLEQAWNCPVEKFYETLESCVPDPSACNTLDQIRETMHLTPMEKPWEYMKKLQDAFDYSKLKYTEDFYDPDMNENAPLKEWTVYFDGTIHGHSGKAKAGREIPVGKEFQFADRTWLVPAVYSCSQGLVVDFCMRVDAEAYQRFFDKWTEKLSGRDDGQISPREQMQAELENPLCLDFKPEITVNGQRLQRKHGSSICYIPSDASNSLEAKQIMNHYHLDCAFAWCFRRISFSWAARRRPEIKTLGLTMVQEPSMVPGEVFEVKGSGDRVTIKMPESQLTLTVQDYEPQILDTASLCPDNMEYPTHYTRMRYTLSPEPKAGHLQINDLMECDQPRLKQTAAAEEQSNCCAASIGIIGGADGPTTILVSAPQEKHEFAAYSSPHFEPAERIQWYPVLQVTEYNPVQVELI